MNNYKFSLIFKLGTSTTDPELFTDALFEAGCDDALLSIGKLGYLGVDFIREGTNAFEAVTSAIQNIKTAIPDATLIEATPDLGGISDIADLLNCSRQNVRQLVMSDDDLPPPVHEGRSPIWHMAEVLSHFAKQERCQVEATLIDLTSVNQAINTHAAVWKKQSNLDQLYPDSNKYLEKIEPLVATL